MAPMWQDARKWRRRRRGPRRLAQRLARLEGRPEWRYFLAPVDAPCPNRVCNCEKVLEMHRTVRLTLLVGRSDKSELIYPVATVKGPVASR